MTDRKAMEMALEALTAHYQSKDEADVHRARVIQALEAALAQPEQTKCPRCGEVTPAEIHTCSPQREWVGLTIEEIKEMLYGLHGDDRTPMLTLVNVVEAKLKEKNGG